MFFLAIESINFILESNKGQISRDDEHDLTVLVSCSQFVEKSRSRNFLEQQSITVQKYTFLH